MAEPMNDEQRDFQPSPAFLKKVEQGMENIGVTTPDEEVVESVDSTPVESQISQAESQEIVISQVDSTPVESQISQAESLVEPAKPQAVDNTPSLPDNYYRAAIHQGWTPEEIVQFFAIDPEKALGVFEKNYIATNKISQTFAKFGRSVIQTQTDANQPSAETKEAKTFVDINALREKYEGDPIVDVVDALQKGLQEALASKELAAPQSTAPASNALSTEDIALAQLVEGFFTSDNIKLFGGFYGGKKELTPLQDMNRYAVVQMADQIIAGAELHGQEMSADEALTMAHLCVTEPVRETMVRKNILDSVKKRSKGITLRPDSSKTAPQKPTTEKEKEKDLITKTQSRLGKLFNKK